MSKERESSASAIARGAENFRKRMSKEHTPERVLFTPEFEAEIVITATVPEGETPDILENFDFRNIQDYVVPALLDRVDRKATTVTIDEKPIPAEEYKFRLVVHGAITKLHSDV